MKVLIVYAHPERRSLNGSLLDVAVDELKSQGHDVKVSDLYAMNWKSEVDRSDFPSYPPGERLKIMDASLEGYATKNGLTQDVLDEQDKMLWADFLVLLFPCWWYSMPAIMKGWVDRVFSGGFAYGGGRERYGAGAMAGKRAMLITTLGSWPSNCSSRGINGYMDGILFPINHGTLYYVGYNVLPPLVVYKADTLDEADFAKVAEGVRDRMRSFTDAEPIAYRSENSGDYTVPELELKPGRERPGTSGFELHIK